MKFTFNTFKKTFLLFISQNSFKLPFVRKCLIASGSLIFLDVLVTSLVPYYSKLIVDSLSINILNSVWIAIIFLGVFWILEKTIIHIQEIIFFPVINLTIRDLTFKVVQHIHQISLVDYQILSIPEVINCMRRISMSARSFIKILCLMILPTIIKLSIAIIVTLQMGMFGFLLFPAIVSAIFLLYKGTQWYVNARANAWQITDNVIMRINDSIMNTKVVRPVQLLEMNHLGNLLNCEAESWYQANTRSHLIHIAIGVLLGCTIAAILGFAVISIQKGALTVGDFVLLKGQLLAAFLPFRIFSSEFRQLAESLIDINKIIQIMEIPVSRKNTTYPASIHNIHQGIFLQNVSFHHNDKKPIFKNLTLHIPLQEKVGIIGKTGSGKTALIHLIAGLYHPNQGEIYIEGQPKETSKLRIHCIPQDFRLFNLSLRYNLCYGIENVSETRLWQVIEEVGLMEAVQQMSLGLESVIGEMGIKLSGGEKQKVALARALLLKPDMLLLDETTNSLNPASEKAILEAIFSCIPMVIIASHRYSTLTYMTRILKIQNGKLTEVDISNPVNNDLHIFDKEPETELCIP